MKAMGRFEDKDTCPACGGSWIGELIPPKDRHLFGTNKPHFSRLIGCELPGYDGVSEWECPHCSATWGRWTNERLT